MQTNHRDGGTAGVPGDQPAVAHVMRIYLRATETFVGNQMASLRRYKPLVLCHHRQPDLVHPIKDIAAEQEMLSGLWRQIDPLAYRLARYTFPKSVSVLADYALAHKVKLLHYHFLVDARFFLALKRQTGLPAIASAYGYDVSEFPRRWGGMGLRYLRSVFSEMDCVIAMSGDMRRDLLALGCPPSKTVVHYYGTDTGRFAYPQRQYVDRAVVTILVAGSLKAKKAQHLVLKALRLVQKDRMASREFRVVLVGEGPTRSRLEQQVAEYAWQERVCFVGHVPHHDPQLVDYYRQADIFTLPSMTSKDGDKEGIPGTIVEAMASGLPVVSTFHGGIPEVVQSGKEGILVTEGDVKALAEVYSDLLNDVSLREELGRQAARRAMNSLDLRIKTAELELIYDSILAGKHPSTGLRQPVD